MSPRSIAVGVVAAAIAIAGLLASGAVSFSDAPRSSAAAASAPTVQAASAPTAQATGAPAVQASAPGPTPTMDYVALSAQISNESEICQCRQ